ncbi:MAG: transglycosylase SLT domain-containing protein [Fibromonadaceae bacterium]|jgi:soluble lytic murein transglycosylase|nr:transglycosylase SLT domain-containing protein [Fibromonadaceae bacterium]
MRFSILHLIFACIATMAFVIAVFIKWDGKNKQIKNFNKEILIMRAKIESIDKQGNKALAYARIIKGLDLLVGKKLSDEQKKNLTEKLYHISVDYKIDPLLILAVIRHESKGDPSARGMYQTGQKSGAFGLMQIKYSSALEVARSAGIKLNSPEDLFDPEINLMVGTTYLLRMIAKYKNLQHALIAYNTGFGSLDVKLKSGEAPSTKYYKGVMKEYRFFIEGIFYFPSFRMPVDGKLQ